MPSIPKSSLLLSRRDSLIAALALAVGAAPIAASALKAVDLLPNGTLKTYIGFSHGMLTVNADVLNADPQAFVTG
jgi:hypothetical protein